MIVISFNYLCNFFLALAAALQYSSTSGCAALAAVAEAGKRLAWCIALRNV